MHQHTEASSVEEEGWPRSQNRAEPILQLISTGEIGGASVNLTESVIETRRGWNHIDSREFFRDDPLLIVAVHGDNEDTRETTMISTIWPTFLFVLGNWRNCFALQKEERVTRFFRFLEFVIQSFQFQ